MSEYPKIETLFDRDEKFKVIEGALRKPEFGLIDRWLVTEKIDGTNVRIEWSLGDGADVVRYKGRTDNAQMPTFLLEHLQETFPVAMLGKCFDRPSSGCLYGEGYGARIQKGGGTYRPDSVAFRLFDVQVGDWWLNWPDVEDVARKLAIATAPLIDIEQPVDIGTAVEWVRETSYSFVAAEDSALTSQAEGIVARTDPLLFDRRGARLLWKLKRKDFA